MTLDAKLTLILTVAGSVIIPLLAEWRLTW